MTAWSPEDAAMLAAAPSLHLTVGTEPRSGVELGMVVVDAKLYVRAFRGRHSEWFQAALDQTHARIRVDTIEQGVILIPHAGSADAIDAAYRAKYGRNSTLVNNQQARRATLRIVPV